YAEQIAYENCLEGNRLRACLLYSVAATASRDGRAGEEGEGSQRWGKSLAFREPKGALGVTRSGWTVSLGREST
ncbi:hypothetical protein, partial [Streptomyces albogriseolus]|uniref:hypothetical protein n=1 Tax=Streptomyces albogriseolus TaxID=1887 RepID=UPI0036BEFB00